MIAGIIPQFFATDLIATLRYYQDVLGFKTQFTYGEPPFYAGVVRDGQLIFFRAVDSATPQSPDKYTEEYLDAYISVDEIDALYEEFRSGGATFSRDIGPQPWASREFVVRDCDGRLLCFSQVAK